MFTPSSPIPIALVVTAALASACGREPQPEPNGAENPAPATPAPAAAAQISLADVAGTWNMRSVSDTRMTVAFVLTAIGDTTGWTITFPNRDPIPLIVAVAGDSITTHAGPYESLMRQGVQSTSDGTLRLQGGNLVGRTVVHFNVTTPDSVRTLTVTGSRAQ